MDPNDHAFECLSPECWKPDSTRGYEWRRSPVPVLRNGFGLEGCMWDVTECPRCGGKYWEWLSYEVHPYDTWTNREMDEGVRGVPWGQVKVRERSSRAAGSASVENPS